MPARKVPSRYDTRSGRLASSREFPCLGRRCLRVRLAACAVGDAQSPREACRLVLEPIGSVNQRMQNARKRRALRGGVGPIDRVPDSQVGRCVDLDEAALEADPGDGKASGADRLGNRVDTPQTSGARRADVPGDRDRASQCPDLVVAVEQQRPPSGVIPKRWRSRMCSSTAVQPSASSR